MLTRSSDHYVSSLSENMLFLFLYVKTLQNYCSYIEDVHLSFCAHLINTPVKTQLFHYNLTRDLMLFDHSKEIKV